MEVPELEYGLEQLSSIQSAMYRIVWNTLEALCNYIKTESYKLTRESDSALTQNWQTNGLRFSSARAPKELEEC